jgi:hypothetical protein
MTETWAENEPSVAVAAARTPCRNVTYLTFDASGVRATAMRPAGLTF